MSGSRRSRMCFWLFSQSCCSFSSQHFGNEVLAHVGPADLRWHYFKRLFCCCIQEIAHAYVPDSCCTLNFNQDRELYWVDPQNIQLKDAVRCQEDAAGRIGNSANLHQKVCITAFCLRMWIYWLLQQILALPLFGTFCMLIFKIVYHKTVKVTPMCEILDSDTAQRVGSTSSVTTNADLVTAKSVESWNCY